MWELYKGSYIMLWDDIRCMRKRLQLWHLIAGNNILSPVINGFNSFNFDDYRGNRS